MSANRILLRDLLRIFTLCAVVLLCLLLRELRGILRDIRDIKTPVAVVLQSPDLERNPFATREESADPRIVYLPR
jgi:hypothetical protein